MTIKVLKLHLLLLIIFFPLLIFAKSSGEEQKLPSSAFSLLPKFVQPKLSPDGTRLAYVLNSENPDAASLAVVNLSTGEKKYLVQTDNEKVKIRWLKWANNKTIIFSLKYADSRYLVDTLETRLFAVESDGSNQKPRSLIKVNRFIDSHFSQHQDDVIDILPDDPEHILVSLDFDRANAPSVYKLNIYTFKKKRVQKRMRRVRQWMTDQQNRVRLGKSLDLKNGEAKIIFRNNENEKWRTLFEFNELTDSKSKIIPIGFALDPNILFYQKYKDDKLALYKVNLSDDKHELVFSDPNYDVQGSLIYSQKTKDAIGFYHYSANAGRIYWDKNFNKFQESIDLGLPKTDNYLVDFSANENIYLLRTENDYQPGVYYIGNKKKNQLRFLSNQYPQLNKSRLVEHKLVSYKARDGINIEGYLTLPPDQKKPMATILHPHGGPGARDFSGFDYWTSFFVNQGYAVFRPNFRGSEGYGYEFAQSQVQAWGLAMQDDLTDAARWLIKQGITDENKICIVGASYGGYAAMMATVKTPNLFKCAVSFGGVTDLQKLVVRARRYSNKEFVENQIGTDTDDLITRSPVFQTDKIKTPILLVHGEDDRVVDVEHSRKMADELKGEGKKVTYIELENGDHYLSIQRNRHLFFRELDIFLKKYLN